MPDTDPEARTLLAEPAALNSGETADTLLSAAQPRARRPAPALLPRGSTLGRYVILDHLGTGGMGVVYAAFDPELDRRVAIKLMQPEPGRRGSETAGRVRLLREAQSMARLTHPNVISVYDVGTYEDSVFVAMEFVDGETLADELKRAYGQGEPPPWRQVLTRFVAAGRGIAAAHAAGIVHRDFKPDNVMVARDARVLVLDFGLARATGAGSQSGESIEIESDTSMPPISSGAMSTDLTKTGTVMGTPAYMSPEQMTGSPVDAPSDQFSFCIALYEGLYGERPFSGNSIQQLTQSVLRQKFRDPTKGSKVPPWVRKAVLRGLSRSPDERYASMAELLVALSRDPARRRRQYALVGLGVLLLGGAAVAGSRVGAGAGPCRDVGDALEGVWDADRREKIRAAFGQVGKAYADESLTRVEVLIDDYAEHWIGQRRDACEATRVRGEQSDEGLRLRMACLDRRRFRLKTLVEVLEEGRLDAITGAVEAAHSLPPLAPCADVEALASGVQPPDDPETYRVVEKMRLQLEGASTLAMSGHIAEGKAIMRDITTQARQVPYRPILAESLSVLAETHSNLGEKTAARAAAEEALDLARRTGHDRIIMSTLVTLMTVEGSQFNDFERARRYAEEADAVLDRRGYPVGQHIHYLTTQGSVAKSEGRVEDAIVALEHALRLHEERGSAQEPRALTTLNSLAVMYHAAERDEEARRTIRRAIAICREHLGDTHPNLGVTLATLARIETKEENPEEALALLQRARDVFVSALGESHSNVAAMDNGRGLILRQLGRLDEALAAYESALAVTETSRGATHLDTGAVLNNLGSLLRYMNRPADALVHHQRALDIKLERLGERHEEVGYALDLVGDDQREAGEYEEAIATYQRSIALFERLGGDDDRRVGYPLSGLGLAYLETDRAAAALPHLERSHRILSGNEGDYVAYTARAAHALSRAIMATDGDRIRARALAEQAKDTWAKEAAAHPKELAEVRKWLQTFE